jgi:hypothetical protein
VPPAYIPPKQPITYTQPFVNPSPPIYQHQQQYHPQPQYQPQPYQYAPQPGQYVAPNPAPQYAAQPNVHPFQQGIDPYRAAYPIYIGEKTSERLAKNVVLKVLETMFGELARFFHLWTWPKPPPGQ